MYTSFYPRVGTPHGIYEKKDNGHKSYLTLIVLEILLLIIIYIDNNYQPKKKKKRKWYGISRYIVEIRRNQKIVEKRVVSF